MRNCLFIILVVTLFAASCGRSDKAFEHYLSTADSTAFSSDITDLNSPSRKILHSADLSYRVDNVLDATTKAEQLVKGIGGIVVKSEVRNSSESTKDIAYKSDSLKRVQVYTPSAALLVKVPLDKADSVIAQLSASAAFVISRNIVQQDVTFAYLSNALKNQRAERGQNAVSYKQPATNAQEILAEEKKTRMKAQQDEQIVDRKIDNLRILEEVNYTTLSIGFIQPEQVEVQIIANIAHAVQTPFHIKLAQAFKGGADIFRNILLFVVQLWPVWLIIFIVVFLYRRRFRILKPKV